MIRFTELFFEKKSKRKSKDNGQNPLNFFATTRHLWLIQSKGREKRHIGFPFLSFFFKALTIQSHFYRIDELNVNCPCARETKRMMTRRKPKDVSDMPWMSNFKVIVTLTLVDRRASTTIFFFFSSMCQLTSFILFVF